jgi:sortase A
MRAMLRFVGSVLAVSGVLLLVDAVLTVAWQEPVSALLAQREQAALERSLKARTLVVGSQRLATEPPRSQAEALRHLARRERARLRRGQPVARIELPTLDRDYTVVEGTDTATLRKGPGHYPDSPLPGESGTVAIAGHRTTYGAPFRTIDQLHRGDPITVTTAYGTFIYRVERTRIVAPDALWVKRAVGYQRLILTACHPLYSAAQRIVVFARLSSSRLPPGAASSDDSSRASKKTSSKDTSAAATARTASQ